MRKMLENRFFLLNITASLIFIQANFWLIFLNLKNLPSLIPLFYFEEWGEKQLAAQSNIWLLVVIPLGLLIADIILAKAMFKKEKLVSQALTLTASLVSFLSFFALWQILARIGVI
ncbi:MAG: hypothetical protein UV05_C0026G0004 [candidate division CPR1 bacterium GW2011_GWA2_42_17]|uniref:DUF1648 domain-containing protein n=1 Tax=candidate division CPR1 bacterium GW2011_GWA2_42_17 TaxID=1618341 RepID=A0A0G1C1Y9_9BACT|nr:MAG: hypothetical protein UV05_C0026G0004 [candidate division CPR1 bacterium GW2011_GWA2_42_17]